MWRAPLLLFGLGCLLLAPSAAAQPPGLQPRIETHPLWKDLQERTVDLPPDGVFASPLKVGARIFVSGGAFACLPDTTYRFTIGLREAGPAWGRVTLEPTSAAEITYKVPQGAQATSNAWTFVDGPSFTLAWKMDDAPDNATFEYHVLGLGRPQLVAGGCQPDPLAQPTRHIDETINVTKPYVPPAPVTATGSETAPITTDGSAAGGESPGAGTFGLAVALAVVLAIGLQRRQRS